MQLITDLDLTQLISEASTDDLGILADYITDKGKGRISLSSEVCNVLQQARTQGEFSPTARAYIAEELQRFGGNSFMNLFRGGAGVSYKEVLCDVAEHLKAEFRKTDDCGRIETAILTKLLVQSMQKMTTAEREEVLRDFGQPNMAMGAAGIAGLTAAIVGSAALRYRLGAMVADASVKALLGRGLLFGASGTAGRGVGALLGPLGWAITAMWTVYDLASPAYRVTVPSVIQLAYMRNKPLVLGRACTHCGASLAPEAKFCSECGLPVCAVKQLS